MFFQKVSSFSSASAFVLLLAATNEANALVIPATPLMRRASGADSIASPLDNSKSMPLMIRDVWSPEITTPVNSTTWKVNDHADVTWNTTAPAQITNPNGTLFLGHLDGTGSENLDLKHPLASYVNLSLGKATIQVPDVPTGKYIVVLMGNSDNHSPEFMIQSGSGGAPNVTSIDTGSDTSSDTGSTSASSSDAPDASAADPPNTVPPPSQSV
ncbi:hypothetical protein J3R30DRAFT_3455550 [Lentinula aciculospora]|uniref:Uncharacterized protein n=1 Tax=Lentinula aciculospora TaxID=153920 RepID=A0A9W9DQV0_9AGAR|nr:hypothetical protein J3R30DRAFT_3455550 [Lentinula aciculospora]